MDIVVTSTALPVTKSGETVNHVIPLEGNCPGPYVMAVIAGELPPGMFLDNATRSIEGVALQDGDFTFTIQIDATGCMPFATTTATFDWVITTGPVAIVLCDPAIIPVAEYAPLNTVIYADVDGLKTTVYNEFAVFNFIVAGGKRPYSIELIDDPTDPDDAGCRSASRSRPSAPASSARRRRCSPAAGRSDHAARPPTPLNQKSRRKFQWKIDTPPIVWRHLVRARQVRHGLRRVAAGGGSGVPPFGYELTSTAPVAQRHRVRRRRSPRSSTAAPSR